MSENPTPMHRETPVSARTFLVTDDCNGTCEPMAGSVGAVIQPS